MTSEDTETDWNRLKDQHRVSAEHRGCLLASLIETHRDSRLWVSLSSKLSSHGSDLTPSFCCTDVERTWHRGAPWRTKRWKVVKFVKSQSKDLKMDSTSTSWQKFKKSWKFWSKGMVFSIEAAWLYDALRNLLHGFFRKVRGARHHGSLKCNSLQRFTACFCRPREDSRDFLAVAVLCFQVT